MRLVDTRTLKVVDFTSTPTPPYAILSHTWEEDEVSYQEMLTKNADLTSKQGYAKIVNACGQARQDSYEYMWIDTCCIDKSSSAELSEAINSMFKWYQTAEKCYVYLSDLSPDRPGDRILIQCKWFTRGWTLQELLAPADVTFYDQSWSRRGTKQEFVHSVSERTRVDADVILGKTAIRTVPVAARMTWAANRKTTRPEDLAYCLLGIFDVNMALLYGEGEKSFRRLQEEIIKRNNDLTILAWDMPEASSEVAVPVLAPCASWFPLYANLEPFKSTVHDVSVTNKGLLLKGTSNSLMTIHVKQRGARKATTAYFLTLGSREDDPNYGGICLRKVASNLFYRDARYPFSRIGLNDGVVRDRLDVKEYYIMIDGLHICDSLYTNYRQNAFHIPPDETKPWKLIRVSPEMLWDATDCLFFQGPHGSASGAGTMVQACHFRVRLGGVDIDISVMRMWKSWSSPESTLHLFELAQNSALLTITLFAGKTGSGGVSYFDLIALGYDVTSMNVTSLDLTFGNTLVNISVSLVSGPTTFEFCTLDADRLQIQTRYRNLAE